jgi:hypothetical protein
VATCIFENVDETHDGMCYLNNSRIIAFGGFKGQDAVQSDRPGTRREYE